MIRDSLRLRLVAGGACAIIVALVIAGVGLTLLFERHVTRALAENLDVQLKQIIATIDLDPQNKIVLSRTPTDPRFSDPLSGLYWQISDDRDQMLRSRSLWDTTLSLLKDDPGPAEVHYHEIAGPAGARVLVAEQQLLFTAADTPIRVRVAVAADLARVAAARSAFATDLVLALGLLGLILAAATTVQIGLGLRPLDAVRRAVANIRAGQDHHLDPDVPVEVRPLVNEVNALLDAREKDIVRSRNRAADLAHGLKTPLAALAADAERLRGKGEPEIARDIETVIEAMRRHVDRELARARLRGSPSLAGHATTPLAPLVRSLVATLSRTAAGGPLQYEVAFAEDFVAPFDRTDLAEVVGNLLENATRHARSRIRISAQPGKSICVEDDGPGIATDLQPAALARGTRLDERGEGTGLGLAIVQDVLEAYGWTLQLGTSELGGLKACCRSGGGPDVPVLSDIEENPQTRHIAGACVAAGLPPISNPTGESMSFYESPGLHERQKNAEAAKQALLAKFRAAAQDPAIAQKQAERAAIAEARRQRQAEREAERKAREAELAAQAARAAELAAQRQREAETAAARAAAEEAERKAKIAAEKAALAAAVEAEKQAERDAAHAARKAARKKKKRRGY